MVRRYAMLCCACLGVAFLPGCDTEVAALDASTGADGWSRPDGSVGACGNGVLDATEACDTAIPAGQAGACPSGCDDHDACTADTLDAAGTCHAACIFAPLTACATGDGCCPAGCTAATDGDCATCGNGTLDGGERCDTGIAPGQPGACPTSCGDGNACTLDTLLYGGTCGAHCSSTGITTCAVGDGCCPAGCNASTDKDCSASCGNGMLEPLETCDTGIAVGKAGACPTSCNDGNACTVDTLLNGATCGAVCSSNGITTCAGGDGCCPGGCTQKTDADCPSDSYAASSTLSSGHGAALAGDGNSTTAWCAAVSATPLGLFGESFDDWWEVSFGVPTTVGAIHMRSGQYAAGQLGRYKIRNFVWAYQTQGSGTWTKIPETDGYINRFQLIFRFTPVAQVKKLRLLVRRDLGEQTFQSTRTSGPCLREAAFYASSQAPIKTQPWLAVVNTFQVNSNKSPAHAFEATDYSGYALSNAFREAIKEVSGHDVVDSRDNFWIGELNQERVQATNQAGDVWLGGGWTSRAAFSATMNPSYTGYTSWIVHEPRPVGFVLSGNYLDFKDRNPDVLEGFYHFFRQNRSSFQAGTKDSQYPVYGFCGGHQLLAMAMNSATRGVFRNEFLASPTAAQDRAQVVGSCGAMATMPGLITAKPAWCSAGATSGCCGLSDWSFNDWPSYNDCCREVFSGDLSKPNTQEVLIELAINRKGGKATPIDPSTGQAHYWAQNGLYRDDLLYLGVSNVFFSLNFNWDYVNPASITPSEVDLLAAHSTNVALDMMDSFRSNNHFALLQALKYKLGPLYSSQFHPDNGIGLLDPTNRRIVKNYQLIALGHLVRKHLQGWTASSTFSASWSVDRIADLDLDTAWCSTAADTTPAVTMIFAEPKPVRHLLVVEGHDLSNTWLPVGYTLTYREKGSATWKSVGHTATQFVDSKLQATSSPSNGYWCGVPEFKGTPAATDWKLGSGSGCTYPLNSKVTYNGAAKKIVCSTGGETIVHSWQELGGATDGASFCAAKGATCKSVSWLFCPYATNYAHTKLITLNATVQPEQLRIGMGKGKDGVCLGEVLALPDLQP